MWLCEQYRAGLVCYPWLRRSRFRRRMGESQIFYNSTFNKEINLPFRFIVMLPRVLRWHTSKYIVRIGRISPLCEKRECLITLSKSHVRTRTKTPIQSTVDRSQGTQIPQCSASVTWGHGRMMANGTIYFAKRRYVATIALIFICSSFTSCSAFYPWYTSLPFYQ